MSELVNRSNRSKVMEQIPNPSKKCLWENSAFLWSNAFLWKVVKSEAFLKMLKFKPNNFLAISLEFFNKISLISLYGRPKYDLNQIKNSHF